MNSRRQISRSLFLTIFIVCSVPVNATSLNLSCNGGGVSSDADVTTGSVTDSYGRTTRGQILSSQNYNYSENVSLEISDTVGRIRMPRNLLPVIKGGKDGWFELTNLVVGDREITATAKVSFVNKPRVHIDRINGSISINASKGSFFGQCSNYVVGETKRAF